jgi:hypothetical protein
LGVINFTSSGYISTRIHSLVGGYDFILTPRNEVSISVVDSGFSFSSQSGRNLAERGLLFGYGHQFTSRLMVSLTGGPSQIEISQFGVTVTEPFFLTNDSLSFRSRIATLGVRFTQFTSPGSGVFHGAKTDLLTVTAGRPLFGRLRGSVDFGHAYNESIRGQTITKTSAFESWRTGVQLSRELRAHTSIYLQYEYQYQTGSVSPCSSGLGCSNIFARHLIGGGINWHGLPRRI